LVTPPYGALRVLRHPTPPGSYLGVCRHPARIQRPIAGVVLMSGYFIARY
jgi:hypothetical protein